MFPSMSGSEGSKELPVNLVVLLFKLSLINFKNSIALILFSSNDFNSDVNSISLFAGILT